MRTVKTVMSPSPVTVGPDVTLATVRRLFESHHFHHVLVVDDNRLVGVVSDRDLLKALSPYLGTLSETQRDLATLNKHVHQIMSHHPVVVQEDCGLRPAAALMLQREVSCLPVVDASECPVGILSWRDLLPLLMATLEQEET